MGFSLSKAVGKVAGFADKATLGVFTGGLTDGTVMSDILKKAGLKPGEGPDLSGVASAAEAAEKIKLFKEEQKRKKEAQFMNTEGKGLRRQASLSFGNTELLDEQGTEGKSIRATGRFDSNRLVL